MMPPRVAPRPSARQPHEQASPLSARLWRHAGVFARFALVGAANTAVDLAIFALLWRWARLFYLLAQAAAYLFGAANSYLLNKLWTFRSPGGAWRAEAGRFLAVNLLSLGVSLLGIYVVAARLGAGVGVGKIAATAAGVVVNYVGDRYWVFRGAA